MLTKDFIRGLYKMREQGKDVTIITSNLCSADTRGYTAYFDTQKEKLLKSGMKIYEFLGDLTEDLHIKSLLIDDHIS